MCVYRYDVLKFQKVVTWELTNTYKYVKYYLNLCVAGISVRGFMMELAGPLLNCCAPSLN